MIPDGIDPEAFRKIQTEYEAGIPEKIAQLKSSLANLKKEANAADLTTLRFMIHKFAGNAATFGYENVTILCKEWDAKLTPLVEAFSKEKITPALLQEMTQLVQRIETEFQKKN